MLRITAITSAALAWMAMGCGEDPPVDAAGMYTIATTNGVNECELMSWMEGASAMGIAVTITQDGDHFTADVGGLAGGGLDLYLGSHVFSDGHIDGNVLRATLVGTRPYSAGGACTATMNADMSASLSGDVLVGTIFYVPQTNDAADCGVLNSCQNEQDFNGTRPPSM